MHLRDGLIHEEWLSKMQAIADETESYDVQTPPARRLLYTR